MISVATTIQLFSASAQKNLARHDFSGHDNSIVLYHGAENPCPTRFQWPRQFNCSLPRRRITLLDTISVATTIQLFSASAKKNLARHDFSGHDNSIVLCLGAK